MKKSIKQLKKIKKPKYKNNNKEDRINFVKYWVNYIKTHPDEDWSEQQNIVIDGQIRE